MCSDSFFVATTTRKHINWLWVWLIQSSIAKLIERRVPIPFKNTRIYLAYKWMLCMIIKLTWSFNFDRTWPLNITVTHFMTDQHTNFKGINIPFLRASRFGFIPCRLPHSAHKIFWRIKIDQWLLKISDSMISNCFNLDLVNLSDYLSLVSFEENNHFEFQVWKISKSRFFITI